VTSALKAIPQQKYYRSGSNSGSIIEISAKLLKGGTSKVTLLSKL